LFDADGLTGEHLAEIDFLPVEADAAAGRDSGCPVMKRIGHIGIVTQNISDKYIVLPKLEPIAKVDFTILETPARKLYSGQHGFGSEIWPFRQHLQKTRDELADDPRVDGPVPVKPRALASGTEPLASLARRQIEADRMHGFPVDVPDDEARCNQLSKDLVGLMGEIGEFANLPRASACLVSSTAPSTMIHQSASRGGRPAGRSTNHLRSDLLASLL
jgi:hypothetical protein